MAKTAIVIGATGLVGRALVRILLDDGDYGRIVIFARRPLGMTHPKLVEKPFPDGPPAPGDMVGDDLFCALGTTIKKAGSRAAFRHIDYQIPLIFASEAKRQGVKHVLLVSAIGSDARSPFFYPKVKGQLEDALMQLGFPSCTIVRPSLLIGPREEYRLGEKIGEKVLRLINPLLVGPLADWRSIKAQDVAQCLVDSTKHPPDGVRIIPSSQIQPG